MKKYCALIILAAFCTTLAHPVPVAAQMMPEFLYELGVNFYQQGRYDEALQEFKKALIVKPDFTAAQEYIELISLRKLQSSREIPSASQRYLSSKRSTKPRQKSAPAQAAIAMTREQTSAMAVTKALDAFEPRPVAVSATEENIIPPQTAMESDLLYTGRTLQQAPVLELTEALRSELTKTIELQQKRSIIVRGTHIQRFFTTQPDTLDIQRNGSHELLVTGKGLGYTYLQVWDDQGRWTLEFLTVPVQPEGPTLDEELRREEEKSRNFLLRYYMDWNLYETGKRFNTLNRQYYTYYHSLTLTGDTPYGLFDAGMTIRTLNKNSDITYYTVGLDKGRFLWFRDFSIRGYDLTPPISNLAFNSQTLRGVMFRSPAFNNKIDYTVFYGRDSQGSSYTTLSPGLNEERDAFLSGADVTFTPTKNQYYRVSAFHGWGEDRLNDIPNLHPYGYDVQLGYRLEPWNFKYEAGYDTDVLGHLLNVNYVTPRFRLSNEIREIDTDFLNMTSIGDRAGEVGWLSTLAYTPAENFYVNSQLNVFRDRRFAAEDNHARFNEDFYCDATYMPDPTTSLRADYSLQNELGRVGQFRYLSPGIGVNKTFDFIKKISTYTNYHYQQNTNFSSPSLDYLNHKINAGIRFSLIQELYFYANKELNWLTERYTGVSSKPNAFESGLDWSGQLFQSPLYATMNFSYRDEEDAGSSLSFLSGEDSIQGYGELTYRMPDNGELYVSTRIRNIWADNPNVTKRLEAEFRGGVRYTWNTGLRWDAVGDVEGYVFRDLNSDGLKQKDEPPVQGIRLYLGKDRTVTTDEFGYYRFRGVRGQKAFINLDPASLPIGCVVTVPITQEAPIINHARSRIDFGVISRSEISGYLFEDLDHNNAFGKNEPGIAGVTLELEDGTKVVSSPTGKYTFPNASTGEHTVTIVLDSVPVTYLPTVAITKKVTVYEGVTFVYNIPFKKVAQEE